MFMLSLSFRVIVLVLVLVLVRVHDTVGLLSESLRLMGLDVADKLHCTLSVFGHDSKAAQQAASLVGLRGVQARLVGCPALLHLFRLLPQYERLPESGRLQRWLHGATSAIAGCTKRPCALQLNSGPQPEVERVACQHSRGTRVCLYCFCGTLPFFASRHPSAAPNYIRGVWVASLQSQKQCPKFRGPCRHFSLCTFLGANF